MDNRSLQKFEEWRQNYDSLTREDHIELWDYIRDNFPDQRAWHLPSVRNFIEWQTPKHVAELGGWDGELAARILECCPWVESWENYDFANVTPVCTDPRYRQIKEPLLPQGDVLVSSHTLEHFKAKDLKKMLRYGFRAMYLDVPLPLREQPQWALGHHTHILEWSWADLDAWLRREGYNLAYDYGETNYEGQARAYTFRDFTSFGCSRL